MVVARLPNHLDDDKTAKTAEIAARCLEILELRVRRRTQTPLPRTDKRAARTHRECPNPELARHAFLEFRVPRNCRVCPPALVRGYVRFILYRAGHPISGLADLLDGDLGRWGRQYAGDILRAQRPVAAGEWHRIHELCERLAVGLSLEPVAEPECGVLIDLAAILGDGLNRPAYRSRESVDAEIIGLQMGAPLVAAAMPPRAAFPHYARLARAA